METAESKRQVPEVEPRGINNLFIFDRRSRNKDMSTGTGDVILRITIRKRLSDTINRETPGDVTLVTETVSLMKCN